MAVAEEDLELDVAAKTGGSKLKPMLLIGLGAVLLIGVVAGATLYLTGALSSGPDRSAAAAAGKTPANAHIPKPAHYLALDPPFVVNFEDKGAMRFLQISVEVMSRDASVLDEVKQQIPAIRNSLVMLFSSQKSTVVGTVEGKEKLRAETLDHINTILKHETGKGGVNGVYFTSFVMQ